MAQDFANPYGPGASLDFGQLYQDALGRQGSADEINAWQGLVGNNGMSNDQLYSAFINDANKENLSTWQASQSGGGGDQIPPPPQQQQYKPNPYLDTLATSLRDQSNTNLQNNVLPGLSWGAQAAGGFGDTRQGIAEGNAVGQATQGLNTAIAGLYGTDYENSQNRDLQRYGIDSNAATSRYGIDSNAYTANRGLDLQGIGLGSQLYGTGTNGLLSQGQGIYGVGNTQQQAAWQPGNNFSGQLSQYTGYGQSTSSTGQVTGSPLAGAISGAGLGYQASKYLNGGGGQGANYKNPNGTYGYGDPLNPVYFGNSGMGD